MTDVLLAENHGVVSRRQLLAAGVDPGEVRRLVRTGGLARVRQGWLSGGEPDPSALRAVRAGGALSCVSALALHGLWAVPDTTLHVRRSRHLDGSRLPPGVKQCHPVPRVAGVDRCVDPLALSLSVALVCVWAETAVALMDSAVHRGHLTLSELTAVVVAAPARTHRLLDRVDSSAESGTESLVRFRLQQRNIALRPQVQIGDIGRVDLLIGDRLVIECDSRAHHTGEQAYAADRLRDRRLVAAGFRVVRLTYQDVMSGWAEAEADILAVIRSKRHRWPRRGTRCSA